MADFWHSIIAMLLFLAALGICFAGGDIVMKTVSVKEMAYRDEVLYEKEEAEISYCIRGDELMSKLLSGSAIDIQICCLDGSEREFPTGERSECVLQKAGFPLDSEYRLDYVYGTSGRTTLLRFAECAKE